MGNPFEGLTMVLVFLTVMFFVGPCGGFLAGRYVSPDVSETTYCEVPLITCPQDSKCNQELIRCDASYTTWKKRAEECQVLLEKVWENVPNYEYKE